MNDSKVSLKITILILKMNLFSKHTKLCIHDISTLYNQTMLLFFLNILAQTAHKNDENIHDSSLFGKFIPKKADTNMLTKREYLIIKYSPGRMWNKWKSEMCHKTYFFRAKFQYSSYKNFIIWIFYSWVHENFLLSLI